MPEFTYSRLGDLVVSHNAARRPIKASDRVAGATPYYGASGVVDWVEGFTHEGDFLLISEDGENLRSRSTPIAFNASGRIWVNNHAHVVTGRQSFDTRFLGYALADTDVTGYLTGSAQPKLTKTALDSILLKLPPARDRAAIVDFLGALDDKIAANQQEVATVEALMIALATRTGQRARVQDLASHSTRSLRPSEFPERVAHFSLPAFDQGEYPEEAERDSIKSNKFLLDEPCVLMSKLNPRIPRIWNVGALPPELSVASTEFVVLNPRGISSALLWSVLSSPHVSVQLESLVAGTSGSHQRVRPVEMLDVEVANPRALDESIQGLVSTLGALAHGRRLESRQLAKTRDELLPLLMSGKVRVGDVEAGAIEGAKDVQ